MNLKNILSSGDYIIPIPLGGKITLQYDDKGNLEKAFRGWDTIDDITCDIHLFTPSINTFPRQIVARTVSGTSLVYGVLYTASNVLSGFGSINDAIIDMYENSPELFSFFAVTAKNTSYTFQGPSSLITWFRANHFNILNGFLIGTSFDEGVLKHFLSTQFPFKCPNLASYLIINGKDTKFVDAAVQTYIVSDVKTEVSETGQVLGKIICMGGKEITVDYSIIVKFDVGKNLCIMLDDTGNICYTYYIDKKIHKKVNDKLVCKFCGRPIEIKQDEITKCGDPYCVSRLYPEIRHFCNILELPVISYDVFMKHVENKELTDICDLLLLDEYKDADIHTTYSKLLDAIIPVSSLRNRLILKQFIKKCSNNPQALMYYLKHPNKIGNELSLNAYNGCKELETWIANPENELVVETMLNTKNFVFDGVDKKFAADPILRGTKIFITGKFYHGNTLDMVDILHSYSAEVTTTFDGTVNLVLVGDIPEDVSGVSIRKAKKNKIPVYYETQFFTRYNIDDCFV